MNNIQEALGMISSDSELYMNIADRRCKLQCKKKYQKS